MGSSGTGIEYLPFVRGWIFDGANDILAPTEVFRFRDQDIRGRRYPRSRPAQFHHLVKSRSLVIHDHEQIDIAVRPGVAARLRPEEDDLFWSESLYDPL